MSCPRCPHCIAAGAYDFIAPDDPALEAPDRRCRAQVPARTYRAAGRCQKWKNLKLVKMTGIGFKESFLLCPHHVAEFNRKKYVTVVKETANK